MKNYFKKNKVSFIVTSAALISAATSAAYAIWQKKHTKEKVLTAEANIIWKLSRLQKQKQDTFPHPTKEDFKKMNGKSCSGIAYQIEIHTYSQSDYGNLSRECAILILNALAENLKDGETLSEYFNRKETEG